MFWIVIYFCHYFRGLLSCVQQCTERVHASVDCKHEPIQQCFRAFEILFKLVIQSRRLYSRAILENQAEDDFRQYVHALFATFNKVVSISSDNLVTTQVIYQTNKSTSFDSILHLINHKFSLPGCTDSAHLHGRGTIEWYPQSGRGG